MPVALRGSAPESIRGFPDLLPKDHQKLLQGNRLADWTASIIRLCRACGVAVILENPANSMLWLYPPVAQQAKFGQAVVFDQCAFGASWKKSTRLQFWNCDLTALGCRCKATGKVCQYSGLGHITLTGRGPDSRWQTQQAAAYPQSLCCKVVEELHTRGIFLGCARRKRAKTQIKSEEKDPVRVSPL